MILPPTHTHTLTHNTRLFFHSLLFFFLSSSSFFFSHSSPSIPSSSPHPSLHTPHHNALLSEDQPLKDRRQGHHSLGNTTPPYPSRLSLFSYSFSALSRELPSASNINACTTAHQPVDNELALHRGLISRKT